MRLWFYSALTALATFGCASTPSQAINSPLHGNWRCSAESVNAEGTLRVNIEYAHRINAHTLKSATETAMLITQKTAGNTPKTVELLFNSAESITLTDSTITYSPTSANIVSIERDELNMLQSDLAKKNFLATVKQPATANYQFEGENLRLYFPESAMTANCSPAKS